MNCVGVGALDRLLGMAFGFAGGVLISLAVVALLGPTLQLDSYAWWQESLLLPHLLLMEGWFRNITGILRDLMIGLGN